MGGITVKKFLNCVRLTLVLKSIVEKFDRSSKFITLAVNSQPAMASRCLYDIFQLTLKTSKISLGCNNLNKLIY